MQHISLVSSAVQNIVINMTFSASKADTFHYIMNYFFIMKYKRCITVLKCIECRGCLTLKCFFYYPVGENLDLCRLIRELNEDKNVNIFF